MRFLVRLSLLAIRIAIAEGAKKNCRL